MNFVQRAQAAGRKAHARASAVPCGYRWVDGGPDAQLRLVPGLRRAESINESGVVVDRLLNRFLAERADFENAKRLPVKGDKIYFRGDEYTVTHPGGGREYEFRDPFAESISIQTVMTGVGVGEVPLTISVRVYGNGLGVAYGNTFGVGYGRSA